MNSAVEEQIILAMNEVYMHFGKWSFPDLEAGFKAAEKRFARELNESDSIEVKRRVAEGILLSAQITNQSVDRCRELLGQLEQLGWSTFYAKPNVLFPFIRYCLNQGRKDVGHHLLIPLIAELEQHCSHTGDEQCVAWLNDLRPLLAELQA